ncbi:hypothetical protein L6452_38976 [Arctium lappa]|uniref:Uncharacterized protein n=1 Tax=Arctium lappa TaxID=4217 RepID=A0ACB8XR13_ARCLA|nr:hypothetical protein L6452_38976 [Arctium lappa]
MSRAAADNEGLCPDKFRSCSSANWQEDCLKWLVRSCPGVRGLCVVVVLIDCLGIHGFNGECPCLQLANSTTCRWLWRVGFEIRLLGSSRKSNSGFSILDGEKEESYLLWTGLIIGSGWGTMIWEGWPNRDGGGFKWQNRRCLNGGGHWLLRGWLPAPMVADGT